LRRALAFVDERRLSPRLITVNSWNEWSESSYLEPDTVNGFRYLEAVRGSLAYPDTATGPLPGETPDAGG
jgi:hypothetical protein